MATVELLTAANWHCSVGDVATALATERGLAERGISVSPVSLPSGHHTCVIGGGHLLDAESATPRGRLLKHFRVSGRHTLNAVGLHTTRGDWSYLSEYRYVSIRDQTAADALRPVVPDVRIVPCPAVLLDPLPWKFVRNIPGYEFITRLTPGEFVVVHAHPTVNVLCDSIKEPIVPVDPQPWVGHRPPPVEFQVPKTHSPEVLLTLVAAAKAVVSQSLHLGIFALAAGTPFALIDCGDDPQSLKLRRYMQRAGLPEVLYRGTDPVTHALALAGETADIGRMERTLATEHLDAMADALRDC